MFKEIDRESMREVFQPSRIVLAIAFDEKKGRYNFIPIAFNMYAGYTPLTFCFAIHNINYSFTLFEQIDKYCISIPGEKLAWQILEAGLVSGKELDKFELFGLTPYFISNDSTCGIEECLINVFCEKTAFLISFIPQASRALKTACFAVSTP